MAPIISRRDSDKLTAFSGDTLAFDAIILVEIDPL